MRRYEMTRYRFVTSWRGITRTDLIRAESRDLAEAELYQTLDGKFGAENWTMVHSGAPKKPRVKVAGEPKRGPITKCKPTRVVRKPLKPAGMGISNYARVEKYGLSRVSKVS